MKIKTLLIATLFCLSLSAAADFRVTEQAYEIPLSEFLAPTTANGAVAFKECADCTRMRVRVTSDTRYSVNGRAVRLDDFRKAVLQVDNREKTPVTVLHHLESDTIVALSVSI